MTGETPIGALLALVDRNKRRYGGFTVHLGFILIVVGVILVIIERARKGRRTAQRKSQKRRRRAARATEP